MLGVTRKLLAFLDSRSRKQFYLLFAPMLATAILEMASIGMILPLSLTIFEGGENKYIALLPFLPSAAEPQKLLLYMVGAFMIFFIVKNAAIMTMLYVITRFTLTKTAHFQQRMFDLYLKRPYSFHLQRNTSEIIRDLSGSINAAFDGLRLILNLLMDVSLAVAASLLLLIVEPKLTLGIGLSLLIMGTAFYRFLAPLLQMWGEKAFILEASIIQSINQGFGAIKDVKVLNCHAYLNKTFTNKTNNLATLFTRSIIANQSPRLVVETIIIIGFLVVVMVLLELRGSVGDVISVLGLFGMAALRLMPSMNRILNSMTEIKQRTAMVDSLFKDYQDGLASVKDLKGAKANGALPFNKGIHFKGVSYSYYADSNEKPALKNIDLHIAKEETLGVVGPSGAGKTTLVDILMGLLTPSEGVMLIDGVDAFTDICAWQRHLGYVPQHIYLMDDTLKRNIAFGVEDELIDDDRIDALLRMAHLDKVAANLPNGVETMLGEQGVRLSGGQQQRIGIARALYRDPGVLVFDEATSSLDSETELGITQTIEKLAGEKTMIIIAHRLSTVRTCDRLVFIKDGEISDVGSFNELQKRNQDFARMAQLSNMDEAP